MNSEARSAEFSSSPVVTVEGRFWRVSTIRKGRVESYLCETEAEARRFAELLGQPPVDAERVPRARASRKLQPASDRGEQASGLRLVRGSTLNWKPRF